MNWLLFFILIGVGLLVWCCAHISNQLAGIIRALAVLANQLADHKRELADLLREIASDTDKMPKVAPREPEDDYYPLP